MSEPAKKEEKEGKTAETTEAPETTNDRTEMPDALSKAIESAAENAEQKERLLDLWEVANGKLRLNTSAVTKSIQKNYVKRIKVF